MGAYATRVSNKYMPDPIIFAFILTIIAYILTVVLTPESFLSSIILWHNGLWNLLAFAMQVSLMIITGYALAVTVPVKRLLESIAKLAKSPRQVVLLTSVVIGVFAYINWAMAAIVGAIFVIAISKHCYKNGIRVDYPFLVAIAFAGQSTWAWGLSNTIALLVNTPGHFMEEAVGLIPMSETILSPLGLIGAVLTILIVTPFIFYFMTPKPERSKGIDEYAPDLLVESEDEKKVEKEESKTVTPADRLDNSKILSYLIATAGAVYIVYYFWTSGFQLTINLFNFVFLVLGLYIYGSPAKYLAAIKQGVVGVYGVIIQYPFYGGIMGLISGSGLGAIIAQGLITIATSGSLLAVTWFLSGVLNIFVPSQGGEFAITAHIMTEAANALGVSVGKVYLAASIGDGWTNLFQPFFALPILGLCRVKAKDIMGYAFVLMLLMAPVYFLLFLLG